MDQYNDIIIKKIIGSYEQALIIDVDNDKLYKYQNNDGNFNLESELSYVDYLNDCQNFIFGDDLQEYISSLSIAKIESAENKIELDYRMLDDKVGVYSHYINNIYCYDDNGKKIIVVLVYHPSNYSNTSGIEKSDSDEKYNKLVDNFSVAMLKIHNAVNMDHNLRTKDEYINSLLVSLTNDYPELNKSFNENAIDLYNSGKSSILIIDDDKIICTLLSKIFTEKYDIIVANDGQEAIETLKKSRSMGADISCIFLDLLMPVVDGFGVLEYLNDNNFFSKVPVIIISGNYDRETRDKAYSYQIADMLEKPFNAQVIKHRIENLIGLYKTSSVLNEMMLEQHEDLRKVINSTVMCYELDYNNLIKKLKRYMRVLTTKFASMYQEYNLNNTKIDKIVDSSAYYDLANYILPKKILSKKVVDTAEDKSIVKNAIINSAMIIKNVIAIKNNNIDYKYATDIIRCYTEKYDGSGYPEGLSGENIPISAQLLSLVVEYINLVNEEKDYAKVANSIEMESGHKFNPKVVEAYKSIQNEFNAISKE